MPSGKTIYPRIPEELNQTELIQAIGLGLYEMVLGAEPEPHPSSNYKKIRLNLSEKASGYLYSLARSNEYKSENHIINLALAYVESQPAWVRATKI